MYKRHPRKRIYELLIILRSSFKRKKKKRVGLFIPVLYIPHSKVKYILKDMIRVILVSLYMHERGKKNDGSTYVRNDSTCRHSKNKKKKGILLLYLIKCERIRFFFFFLIT